MNYIGLLSQEEKVTLCKIMTGREFKEFFKMNERAFSNVQKGFRAKTLTEQHALSIALNNVDNEFIATCVNTKVDIWLKDIRENIEKLEGEGLTHDTALAATMLDSVFDDNIALYFKLVGETLDTDSRSKLCKEMDSIRSERIKNAKVDDRIKFLEEENRHLRAQLDAVQQRVDTVEREYKQSIQELEQDKSILESLLVEEQEKNAELQTAPTAAKSDDADYLAQFDDTDPSILPFGGSNKIVSLCGVISDYNGKNGLFVMLI